MYELYIGDVDDKEVLAWVIENISDLVMTTRHEYAYNDAYHGETWSMDTTDVSDVSSSRWDTMTKITFTNKDDAVLTCLRWGGKIH
jgi:hypothetical protein